MRNGKKAFIALGLGLSMLVSGCGMVQLNTEKDRAQVVAKVVEETISKGQVLDIYESQKYLYGITAEMEKDKKQKEYIKDIKEAILDSLVDQKVIELKAKEKGFTNFTDEERKEAEDQVQDMLDTYRKSLEENYKKEAEKDKSIDPAKKAAEELENVMKEQGLTRESLIEDTLKSKANTKLVESVTKDVKATDADIQKYYDDNLKSQKESYTKTPSQFEIDENSGAIILYQPAGFIRVKHILIKLPDENLEKIQDLEDNEKADEAKKEREKALESIKPKAEEVLSKVQANEDFDKLIEEYGEDPGMKVSPAKEKGYLVGKDSNYVPEFLNAALKLQNVGDVSGLVATEYGYHIIKLVEKVPEGPIALETVKDAVADEVTRQKQDEAWTNAMEQWRKEVGVEKFVNRL